MAVTLLWDFGSRMCREYVSAGKGRCITVLGKSMYRGAWAHCEQGSCLPGSDTVGRLLNLFLAQPLPSYKSGWGKVQRMNAHQNVHMGCIFSGWWYLGSDLTLFTSAWFWLSFSGDIYYFCNQIRITINLKSQDEKPDFLTSGLLNSQWVILQTKPYHWFQIIMN